MFGWPDHVTLLFLAASFCALCYLFVCARPGRSWLKSVLKTLSVGLLALVAFQLADRLLLGVALTCCAVGDFFLSRTTSDQGLSEAFVTSLGAFGIGHLAYAALFALQPGADLLRLKDGWPLVLALGLLGLVVLYLALRRAGRLRFGVALYIPFGFQSGHGLAQFPARDAQGFGQLAFRGQPFTGDRAIAGKPICQNIARCHVRSENVHWLTNMPPRLGRGNKLTPCDVNK